MNQLFAIFLIIVAAIYTDVDSEDFISAYVLPVVLTLSLAYLFWFRGFLAVAAIVLGIYNTDLESTMVSEGILWPVFSLLAFIYLVFWMSKKAVQERSAGAQGTGGYYGGGDSCGSGDGGCDGGGGGE